MTTQYPPTSPAEQKWRDYIDTATEINQTILEEACWDMFHYQIEESTRQGPHGWDLGAFTGFWKAAGKKGLMLPAGGYNDWNGRYRERAYNAAVKVIEDSGEPWAGNALAALKLVRGGLRSKYNPMIAFGRGTAKIEATTQGCVKVSALHPYRQALWNDYAVKVYRYVEVGIPNFWDVMKQNLITSIDCQPDDTIDLRDHGVTPEPGLMVYMMWRNGRHKWGTPSGGSKAHYPWGKPGDQMPEFEETEVSLTEEPTEEKDTVDYETNRVPKDIYESLPDWTEPQMDQFFADNKGPGQSIEVTTQREPSVGPHVHVVLFHNGTPVARKKSRFDDYAHLPSWTKEQAADYFLRVKQRKTYSRRSIDGYWNTVKGYCDPDTMAPMALCATAEQEAQAEAQKNAALGIKPETYPPRPAHIPTPALPPLNPVPHRTIQYKSDPDSQFSGRYTGDIGVQRKGYPRTGWEKKYTDMTGEIPYVSPDWTDATRDFIAEQRCEVLKLQKAEPNSVLLEAAIEQISGWEDGSFPAPIAQGRTFEFLGTQEEVRAQNEANVQAAIASQYDQEKVQAAKDKLAAEYHAHVFERVAAVNAEQERLRAEQLERERQWREDNPGVIDDPKPQAQAQADTGPHPDGYKGTYRDYVYGQDMQNAVEAAAAAGDYKEWAVLKAEEDAMLLAKVHLPPGITLAYVDEIEAKYQKIRLDRVRKELGGYVPGKPGDPMDRVAQQAPQVQAPQVQAQATQAGFAEDSAPPPALTADPSLVALVRRYHQINLNKPNKGQNWFRVLIAFGAETDPTLEPFTAAEARQAEKVWGGWTPIREELERLEYSA